jgi:hypothetical protein
LRTAQLRALDFELAGPLANGVCLLLQFGTLFTEAAFPIGHFCFTAFDLRGALAEPAPLGR